MEQKANDRLTNMTDMVSVMNKLTIEGFSEQFKIVKGKMQGMDDKKSYKPGELTSVNFYRFEGPSNPDDMSILYAIETADGRKGTLVDAYGRYADEEIGKFMKQVDIEKKVVNPNDATGQAEAQDA
jgi:hypothetical protein